ncbi:MAG: ABC transporter permease [Bdellovibrionota bacterium]
MITSFFHELGGLSLFVKKICQTFLRTRGNFHPIFAQAASVSYRSLSTVLFAGVFVGAILVLQFNLMLTQYDAQTILGGLNTSAVVREVGPLIISFLLAGKVGAYTAAELGTMRVTEQIEAIECLGTDSIQYLIVPRFFGIVLAGLLLLGMGLMVSVIGSMFVATVLCDMNYLQFASSIPRFTGPTTIVSGVFRSLVYSVIVAGVSCYKGYTASGGARGVGRAVTLAAVYTNLFIVIANYVTSAFLEWVGHVSQFLTGSVSG